MLSDIALERSRNPNAAALYWALLKAIVSDQEDAARER
jgi:hypothetical protein